MRSKYFTAIAMLVFAGLLIVAGHSNVAAQGGAYTPEKGSAERKAILDAVRKYRKAPSEVYSPTHFKVQNGYAFIHAEDPDEPGVDTMAFYYLLRRSKGKWKVVDEVNMTEGSDYGKEIKRIRKRFPRAPAAIFSD